MKRSFTKLDYASWYTFILFATSSVITPICLPEISNSLSTNLSENGAMESARTYIILVITVLAGLFAHKWGKKSFLATGQYLLAAGLLLISFAHSYPAFIIALMLAGIGGGCTEALINPLAIDLHPKNSGKFLNITNAFYPVGVLLASVIFGELLTLGYSWRLIFRVASVGALFAGIFLTMLRFPVIRNTSGAPIKVIKNIIRMPFFWIYAGAIFLCAGVESVFTFWSRSYVQVYLQDLPRAGAIAVALFAAMMAIGRLITARISKKIHLTIIMIYSAILGCTISIIIPFISNLIAYYSLLALAGISVACFWPTILAEASGKLKTDSTILLILLSGFGIAGFGFAPWIMGLIGDKTNLKTAFFIIPVLFIILIGILVFEKMISRKIKIKLTR